MQAMKPVAGDGELAGQRAMRCIRGNETSCRSECPMRAAQPAATDGARDGLPFVLSPPERNETNLVAPRNSPVVAPR
jgi:hypothetical protein